MFKMFKNVSTGFIWTKNSVCITSLLTPLAETYRLESLDI